MIRSIARRRPRVWPANIRENFRCGYAFFALCFAALPAIMSAKKKPLVEMKLSDLAADANLRIKYSSFEPPPARKAGVKVKTVAELVDKLKGEAKVI